MIERWFRSFTAHLCPVTLHQTLLQSSCPCSIDDAFLSSTKSNALVMLVPIRLPSTAAATAPSVYFYFCLWLSLKVDWGLLINGPAASLFRRQWQKTKHFNTKTIRGHIDIDFPGKTHLSIYWPPLGLTDRLGHPSKQQQISPSRRDGIGSSVNLSCITLQFGQQGAIESLTL